MSVVLDISKIQGLESGNWMKIHCQFYLNKKYVGSFPKQNVITSAQSIICNTKDFGVQTV